MANISAAMVKELREKTGAGMMDCKRALTATYGDFDKAITWLRENGFATAEKKAGRATTEGWVYGVVENDGKTGALVEVNIETDFAAKNEKFQLLVKNIALQALSTDLGSDDVENRDKLLAAPYNYNKDITLETAIKEEVGTIGENITFRRVSRYKLDEPGFIDIYIHGEGRVGVMIELQTGTEDTAKNEVLRTLAKDLAMQIAAMKPLYLDADSVPEEVLENEREVARAAARKEGKPEKINENIVTGKLKSFYSDFCQLEQYYIHEQGTTVEKAVENAARNLDDSVKISRFLRYERGEGLEKQACCSFADEVAQLQ